MIIYEFITKLTKKTIKHNRKLNYSRAFFNAIIDNTNYRKDIKETLKDYSCDFYKYTKNHYKTIDFLNMLANIYVDGCLYGFDHNKGGFYEK